MYIQLQTVKNRPLIALSSRNFLEHCSLPILLCLSIIQVWPNSSIHSSYPPPNQSIPSVHISLNIIHDISYLFYLVHHIPVINSHDAIFQSFFSTSFHVDHHMCHIFHPRILRLFSLLRNSCVKRTGCPSKHY